MGNESASAQAQRLAKATCCSALDIEAGVRFHEHQPSDEAFMVAYEALMKLGRDAGGASVVRLAKYLEGTGLS